MVADNPWIPTPLPPEEKKGIHDLCQSAKSWLEEMVKHLAKSEEGGAASVIITIDGDLYEFKVKHDVLALNLKG